MFKRLEERFHSKYIPEPNTGCWLWMGAMQENGYGSVKQNKISLTAHRASWVLHHGFIPKNLNVCHKCDERSCVNPAHLFLETQKENIQDMIKKGRRDFSQKLSAEIVREIRNEYKGPYKGKSLKSLAIQYGVSLQNVHYIVKNKIWKI